MFSQLFYTLGLDNSVTQTLSSGGTSFYSVIRTCLTSEIGDPVEIVETCGYSGGFFLYLEMLGFFVISLLIVTLAYRLLKKLSH